ncbi:hypothetical protein NMY22_g16196 [Coprinellus aureogranulatus]|nr:hypothetical protein NMY22_g16196 [Coprinellus aureogranulatus]
MVDLSMIPTHLLESPPKPLPDRLWELEFPRKDTTPNDRRPIHLAPFLHRRAPGRETLPSVSALLEDCAEAMNDTPLPSVYFVPEDAPSTNQAPPQRPPSFGPIRTPHDHSTPSIANYTKPATTISSRAQQQLRIEKARHDLYVWGSILLSSPSYQPAFNREPSLWPWHWYACDVKAGLEWYGEILEKLPGMPDAERLMLFGMAFQGIKNPPCKETITQWQERLGDPTIRVFFLRDVELGRDPRALFKDYAELARDAEVRRAELSGR